MSERRRWDLYVSDMLQACERVMAYTTGMDQAAFIGDSRTYDATLRNLELIGEAATRIPEAGRDSHADIPWRDIIGARNRIIHGYLGIDDDLIWGIVSRSVPALIPLLRALLEEADGEEPADAR